jgi:hypothetical protein
VLGAHKVEQRCSTFNVAVAATPVFHKGVHPGALIAVPAGLHAETCSGRQHMRKQLLVGGWFDNVNAVVVMHSIAEDAWQKTLTQPPSNSN